jgi:transcriptional regulator with XRE-family HTH domain
MSDEKPITPDQSRGARAMLGWSREQLADRSKVANATLADFEAGKRTPYQRTLADVRRALEEGGIEFIPENGGGPGARLRERITGSPKKSGPSSKAHAKSAALAHDVIDKHLDPAMPDEEKATRKRRLLKGPSEFRDMRRDQPAKKR